MESSIPDPDTEQVVTLLTASDSGIDPDVELAKMLATIDADDPAAVEAALLRLATDAGSDQH